MKPPSRPTPFANRLLLIGASASVTMMVAFAVAAHLPEAHAGGTASGRDAMATDDPVAWGGPAASFAGRHSGVGSGQVATVPGMPEELSAVWRSGEAALGWKVPASDGGAPITGYEYRYKAGTAEFGSNWTSAGTDHWATATGLSNGVRHDFEVRAVNSMGGGVAASIAVMPLPAREGDIRIGADLGNSWGSLMRPEVYYKDQWSVVCNDYFGRSGAIVACRQLGFAGGYHAEMDDDPNHDLPMLLDDFVCMGHEGRLLDCKFTDRPNCFINVEVQYISCDTTALGPPRDPTLIRGASQATLVWNRPHANGGSPIDRYEYRYQVENGSFSDWSSVGRDLMAEVPDPGDGADYVFEVRVVNADGATKRARTTNGVITGFTLLDAATGRGLREVSEGDMVLLADYDTDRLDIRVNVKRGATIGSMTIGLVDETEGFSRSRTVTSGQRRLFGDADEAVPRGNYRVSATAYSGANAAGTVLDTLDVDFELMHVKPDPPRDLTAHWTGSAVSLRWRAPESDGGTLITGYEYRYKVGEGSFDDWIDDGPDLGTEVSGTGVTDGAAVTYEVSARNEVGPGDATSLTTPVKPGPPQSLLLSVNRTEATLSWSAPSHNGGASVSGYQYRFRDVNGGIFSEWADDTGSDLTETVSGLTDGGHYLFEVQAMNSVGASETRRVSTGAIDSFTLVQTPYEERDLQELEEGTTVVLADYAAWRFFSIRANPVAGFPIGSMKMVLTGPASNTRTENWEPYTIFGEASGSWPELNGWQLPAGSYRLEVAVYSGTNLSGTELDRVSINFTVVKYLQRPPGPPLGLTVDWTGSQATLSWQAPQRDGLSAITGYQHRYKVGVGAFTDWLDPGSARSADISGAGLTDGATVTYEVRAQNAKGDGAVASLTTPVAPGPPEGLSLSASGTKATLSWSSPSQNGGASVSGYQYRYRDLTHDAFNNWADAGIDLTETVSGLTDGRHYLFEVRASNSVGAGAVSGVSTGAFDRFRAYEGNTGEYLFTLEDGTYLVRSNYFFNGLSIWPDLVPGFPYGSIRMEVKGPRSGVWRWGGVAMGWPLPDGSYRLDVTVYSGKYHTGAVVDRVSIDFTVRGDVFIVGGVVHGPPGPPQRLMVDWTGSQATLSWQAPQREGLSAITGYQHRYKVGEGSFDDWTDAGSARSAGISSAGVTDGATVTYEVRAQNAKGDGAVASLTTPVAPGPPEGLSLRASGTKATLSWSSPSQNGGASVSGYQYRYRDLTHDSFNDWDDAGIDLTETVSELTDGADYVYEVRAVNGAGPGATKVVATRALTGFTLIDAETGVALQELAEGDTIVLADYGRTRFFSIRANPVPGLYIGSMSIGLHGPGTRFRAKGLQRPLGWPGNSAWSRWVLGYSVLTAGNYRLDVPVHVGEGLTGAQLERVSLNFMVVNTAPNQVRSDRQMVAIDPPHSLRAIVEGKIVALSWQPPASGPIDPIPGHRMEYSGDAINRTAPAEATTELTHRHQDTKPEATHIDPITGYRLEYSGDATNWTALAEATTELTYRHQDTKPGLTHFYAVSALASGGVGSPALLAITLPCTTLWCADLTVGTHDGHYGYSHPGGAGALSSDTFSVDGSEYAVKVLGHDADNLTLGLDRGLEAGFVLRTEGLEFASGEATIQTGDDIYAFQWPKGTLSWLDGDAAEVTLALAAAGNNPATRKPTVTGTPRVGETLTVDTSDVDDADGLDNVVFSYQWIRSDGGTDTDISGETRSTYTLVAADVGKTVKVRVSFTDDSGNEETLTSEATTPVSQAAAGPPGHLRVFPRDTQGLDASWEAPASDGGSPITGYTVQWKEGDHSWDTAADVSQATVTGTTHTINGLTEGVEYAVRVMASNEVGDGEPSAEMTGTPRETTQPQMVRPRVDGATLRVFYDEALDEASSPPADAFDVRVALREKLGGSDDHWRHEKARRPVEDVQVTGDTVVLTLALAVRSKNKDYVVISYVPPSDEAAPRVRDVAGNAAAGFRPTQVFNDTAEATQPNTAPAGAPTIKGTAQVGEALTADTSDIEDDDGLDNVIYSYQWIRNDGSADTDIQDATVVSYTLTADDEGKAIKVRVSFTDDAGNEESLTSEATEAVAAANSPATEAPQITGTAQVGETLTAGTSDIKDDDGLDNVVYSYQWVRNDGTTDTDIQDAAETTYTLATADVGKAIKVRVSFADDAGNEESLTSEATEAVVAKPTGEVWSATMTVGTGHGATGYSDNFTPVIGALTPNAITVDGDSQTVRALGIAKGKLGLSLERKITVGFVLQVGTTAFASDDASTRENHSAFLFQWDDQGLNWSEGDQVAVSLTLTDASEDQEPRPNTPATGQPAISGKAQVGETLSADTADIADADGDDDAVYSYQWIRVDGGTETDIPGATAATYGLADADEGKTIKVKVSFTDDAGNEEAVTSKATETVAPRPPLTVSLDSAPTTHDGTEAFTFDIRFSEEFGLSFETLRNHAFVVTGGSVTKAKRVDAQSNIHWRITVEPDANGDVTVVLPVTDDCDATGAICTGDGRKLSNSVEFTASGPDE